MSVVAKVPNEKAEKLERMLKNALDYVGELEEEYGDECKMDGRSAQEINDILDGIGAFVINSL